MHKFLVLCWALLCCSACGQTLPLQAHPDGIAYSVYPGSLSFGSVTVGSLSSAQQVTVAVTSAGFTLSSPYATVTGDFIISSATCSNSQTLSANSTCTISIEFNPTQAGTRTGTLVVGTTTGYPHTSVAVALNGTGTGGPPNYPSARTDLNTISMPSVPPQVGPNTCTAGSLNTCGNLTGAGTTVTDPNFGTTICRLTDSNTTSRPTHLYFSNDVTTSQSSDENLWSYDHSMLVLQDSGGWYYPMNFAPPCTSSRMYATNASWSSSGGFYFGAVGTLAAPTWARTNHYYLYGVLNGGTTLGYLDFTGNTPSGTPPTFTNVFDFTSSSNCLGAGFTATWMTNGGNTGDDNDFGYGFSNNGGQGGAGAIYVAVWRRGSGCRVLNINTLTVTGDWGSTGAITGTACTGTIHNVKILKAGGSNGAILVNYSSACADGHGSPYVWFYTGLTFQPVCGLKCNGHFTESDTLWDNFGANALPDYMDSRPASSPSGQTGLISAFPGGSSQPSLDAHFGATHNDTWPFIGTTNLFEDPFTYNPLNPSEATAKAWNLEVIGVTPGSANNPKRFASTFATSFNRSDTSVGSATSSLSPDGLYLMWASDWEGTLGSTSGSSSCVIDGPYWKSGGVYEAGAIITPAANHNSGNYTYQTTAGGTAGTTEPSPWNQTISGTQSDGGITDWKNLGAGNCRGDVFVIPLQ